VPGCARASLQVSASLTAKQPHQEQQNRFNETYRGVTQMRMRTRFVTGNGATTRHFTKHTHTHTHGRAMNTGRMHIEHTSLWGRPAAEKMGIFWPRAMEFMVSMAEMPVWIISSG
jgi:hypothetical protein